MSAEATQKDVEDAYHGRGSAETMERVTVRLSKDVLDDVEALVEAGVYPNRSEAIRDGVRDLVRRGEDDGE